MSISDIIATHGSFYNAVECVHCREAVGRMPGEDFSKILSLTPISVSISLMLDHLIYATKPFANLTGYLPAPDIYAAAGYPLGKSQRGRNKWMNRYERQG